MPSPATSRKVEVDSTKRIFKVVINAPIRDVWREITRTDAPIACFFNSRMHLSPGGLAPGSKLAMRTPNGRDTGVVGEIIECREPTHFSHTFKFTSFDDPWCKVSYDLREVPGGTEFTLKIIDAAPGSKTEKQMVQGGRMIAGTLRDVAENGKPSLLTRILFGVFGLFPVPKQCRSEHWPV